MYVRFVTSLLGSADVARWRLNYTTHGAGKRLAEGERIVEASTCGDAHDAKLAFHGGLNAALFGRMDELLAEVFRIVPILMHGGDYVVASDHSVPDSISLEEFRGFVEHAKRVATY